MSHAYIGQESLVRTVYIQLSPSNNVYFDLESGTVPDGWILLGQHDVEISIPDSPDINDKRVASLERVKENLIVEHGARIEHINSQIQNLLVLEHQPDYPVDRYADDPREESAAL